MSTVNTVGILTEVFSSLAFVTNSLVAAVLLAQFRTLTPMLLFILNLMFVDGLFALFGAVFRAPGMLIGNFYQMNQVMVWLCPMLPYFIGTVPPLCSIAILFITVDRFIAITKPMQYPCYMNRQIAIALITWAWGLGAVKVLLELLLVSFTGVLSVIYDSNRARCAFTSEEYIIIIQTLGYLVPFLIMCVLYILMILEILKQLSNRDLVRTRQGSKAKVFITTTLITVAFFVTWFPYYVTMVRNVVFKHKQKGFVGTVVMFYLNLLWDPIVYALRTPVVYKMCTKIARKGFGRNAGEGSSTSRAKVIVPTQLVSTTEMVSNDVTSKTDTAREVSNDVTSKTDTAREVSNDFTSTAQPPNMASRGSVGRRFSESQRSNDIMKSIIFTNKDARESSVDITEIDITSRVTDASSKMLRYQSSRESDDSDPDSNDGNSGTLGENASEISNSFEILCDLNGAKH